MAPNNAKTRRDYVGRAKLIKRMDAPTEGGMWSNKYKVITVPYTYLFDDFAARVAYSLRRLLIYRSDGGRMARGLVRISGDLERLHQEFAQWRIPKGQKVKLKAGIQRRKGPQAGDRWVMNISFEHFVKSIVVEKDEGEKINAGMQETSDEMFNEADALAIQIGGDEGRRIRAYLDSADNMPFHKMTKLWIYRTATVSHFVKKSESEQERILLAGGAVRTKVKGEEVIKIIKPIRGKIPYKGQQVTYWWRRYPFRSLLDDYTRGRLKSNNRFLTAIKAIDEHVGDSISASVSSAMFQSKRATSKHVIQFRKHLAELLKDTDGKYSDSLYYLYDKNTTDDRSFLEKYG